MANGPLGGNMGSAPVPPQPPQVSFTTTAESRGGFNNFLKSIPPTTAMTPLPPMGSSPMPPMGGNPMANIDIFNQPMGMMGMNQPPMNPMMQPPMQTPMMMAGGGNVPPRRTEIMGQPHMLSYITPEEGGILKALGGSGAPGPMGIPSFFDAGEGSGGYGSDDSATGGDDNNDDGDDDSQDYSDGSGSQDTGNVEDSYSGDYTGGSDNNDNQESIVGDDPVADVDFNVVDTPTVTKDEQQQNIQDAQTFIDTPISTSPVIPSKRRNNIINSPNYDPQFAADSLASRGLDPQGFMSAENYAQTTQGQADDQAQMDDARSIDQAINQVPAASNIASSYSPQAFGLGLDLDDPLGLGINTGFGPAADAARNREALTGAFGTPDYTQMAGPGFNIPNAPNTQNAMFTGPEDALMSGRSRGASINNPGNIRGGFGGDNQIGTTPDGFAIFDNLQSGKDAIGTLANTYGDKYGINTIDAFNQRYSPVGKENTQAAVDTKNSLMADALGVDLNANVDFTDPNVQGKITNAVMQSEIGKQGMQDVNALTGINLSQLAPDSTNIAPDPMATDRSPGRMSAVFGPETASTFGGLTPNEVMNISGITSPGQTGEIPVIDNGFINRQLSSLVNKTLGRDDFVNPEDRTTDIFSPSASDFANFQSTRDQLAPEVASSMNRGRSGGGAQNIAPQNSIQNALNRAARGNRGIELGDFPQTIGPETPSGFSAIGSGRTGQTPTTDTVFDIDTTDTRNFVGDDFAPALDIVDARQEAFAERDANVRDMDDIDRASAGRASDFPTLSTRPADFEEKVGRDFNANRMADIERLYNEDVGQTKAGRGTDPSLLEGLGVPTPLTIFGDAIERGSRERMANEIAMGRPMGLGETLFGYDAPNLETQTMEDYMSNVQPNYDFGDFNQTSRSIPEKQLIRSDSGRVIGIRDESGRLVSGRDPNAPIDTGDDNDSNPLILKPIKKAKKDDKKEDKPPNVIGGVDPKDPVSSGSVVVDSPFTTNVGDFKPVGFSSGDLNKLIAAITGIPSPKSMAKGGVIGYQGGGRVMQALDNLLATG